MLGIIYFDRVRFAHRDVGFIMRKAGRKCSVSRFGVSVGIVLKVLKKLTNYTVFPVKAGSVEGKHR